MLSGDPRTQTVCGIVLVALRESVIVRETVKLPAVEKMCVTWIPEFPLYVTVITCVPEPFEDGV
jgi:hypothetical protein